MLLVKYIMQLTVSPMPASVHNEMKRKKYDQERMRYTSLRAKKERRSGSVEDVTPIDRNNNKDNDGGAEKISMTFKTSPCPPIRESAAESHSLSSSQEFTVEGSLAERCTKNDERSVKHLNTNDGALNDKPTGSTRRVVNVRETKRHSPMQEQKKSCGGSLGDDQRLPVDYHGGYSAARKYHGVAFSSSPKKYRENDHPNFEEAINKLPLQHSSSYKIPSKGLGGNLTSEYERGVAAPPPSARQDYGSRQNMVGQGQHQHYEDLISPTSSLSTIPQMPTPCQLNLDSDDDDTYENYTTHAGFYQGATAPPLSPAEAYRGYGAQRTISSRMPYFDEHPKDNVDDDHTRPKAKWGIHHIAHYAKSERSLGLSEHNQKKSR
jgi:hypothetical protein